jgi:cellobiose epimerase
VNALVMEINKEMTDHILPFWIKQVDEENGGFYGTVNYDLTVNRKGEKGGVAASRFLWSFSAAYRVTGNPKYLSCAKHAYKFLTGPMYDTKHGGIYWSLNYKGEPVVMNKHVYAQAFAIYALSEYYRATKHEEALEYAKKIFNLIETVGFDKNNQAYKEEFNRVWNELPNDKLSENGVIADVTTNTHLHVLEAYTNLYRVLPMEEVKQSLTKLVDTFYSKIYDKETKYLKVFFDKHWNSILEMKSFGHDIEASWLLDDALKVLGLEEEKYVQMVIDIAYNIAGAAVLDDDSLANEQLDGLMDHTKIWWVQAEAMVGFLNAFQRTNNNRFMEIVRNLWHYTKFNIVDKREGGEWYWSIEADGKPTERAVAEPWKTPYHNTRFCLEVIERMGNE